MHIIGIAGKSGSGKTTVAGLLATELNNLGYTVIVDAFAVEIKRRLRDCGRAEIDKEADRAAMQVLGTALRNHDVNYFVDKLAARNELTAAHFLYGDAGDGPADFLIVADVRYPNEAAFCRRHGVVVLVDGTHRPLPPGAAEHESEVMVDSIAADYVITKQRSLGLLADAVKALVADGHHLKRSEA